MSGEPPIILWAGLGEMSRIGDCVLHPFLGPRLKAAVVTTDIDQILQAYPELTREMVEATLQYAMMVIDEEKVIAHRVM